MNFEHSGVMETNVNPACVHKAVIANKVVRQHPFHVCRNTAKGFQEKCIAILYNANALQLN